MTKRSKQDDKKAIEEAEQEQRADALKHDYALVAEMVGYLYNSLYGLLAIRDRVRLHAPDMLGYTQFRTIETALNQASAGLMEAYSEYRTLEFTLEHCLDEETKQS